MITNKTLLKGLSLLVCAPIWALPNKNLSFDIAFGTPHLLTFNGNFQLRKRFQVGLGYGLFPSIGLMATGIDLPAVSVSGPAGITLAVYPKTTASIYWVNPYMRFFPTNNDNFYFQFSYFYYAVALNITSRIEDGNSQLITQDGISGVVTLRQFLPTIGIGCIFGSNLFFFNLNMGYSFVGATTMSVELTGTLGRLGALNAEAAETMKDSLSNSVTTVSDGPKRVVANWPFPSITISFGFYL